MTARIVASVLLGLALDVAAVSAARGAEVGRATGLDTVLVEDWSGQEIGHVGVPVGWEKQNWGQPKYDFRIEERHDGDRAQKVLHLRSEGDNSTITKRVGKIDVRKYPVLRWQWRAVTLPTGADARNAATDDQAAQVYLVFPRFPPAVRSRIIGYIWDTTAPAGSSFRSQTAGMVTYVVVRSGPADLGRWILESRNVLDDYRRIYGGDPDEMVEAVSIGIDSNDTRSRAESYMGDILFSRFEPIVNPRRMRRRRRADKRTRDDRAPHIGGTVVPVRRLVRDFVHLRGVGLAGRGDRTPGAPPLRSDVTRAQLDRYGIAARDRRARGRVRRQGAR